MKSPTETLRGRRPCLLALALVVGGCAPGGLRGVATLDGAGDSAGILVSLAGPQSGATLTAPDGSYAFADLPDGVYAVVASAGGTREGSLSATATLAQGRFAPLVFHPVGGIRGRVTRGGAATGNAGILVIAPGSTGVATTDDSGAYALDELAPGTYQLRAYADGYAPGAADDVAVARGRQASAPQIDLVAAPTSETAGALSGRATLVGLDDSSGITVSLVGTSLSTTTASDGSFTLPNPPPGIYSLSFDRGPYHELAPSVLTLTGANGFYLDGSLYSMSGSTLIVPRGQRRVNGGNVPTAQLTPNGDHLLFTKAIAPAAGAQQVDYQLWTVPVAGGAPVLITDNLGLFAQPLFSPDGTRVLYLAGVGEMSLYGVAVGGGTPTLLATDVNGEAYGFSPDGSSVVLFTNPASLQIIPTSGGAPTTLRFDAAVTQYAFAPSGELLVLAGKLLRVPLSGATQTTVASSVRSFAVSPTWDHVAYATAAQLYLYDWASGVSTAVGGNGPGSAGTFTSDGAYLVYVSKYVPNTSGELDSVAVASPSPSPSPTVLVGDIGPSTFRLSPGGTQVYLENDRTHTLSVVPVAGGALQTLATAAGAIQLAFSPKGRWVQVVSTDFQPATSSTLSVGPAESPTLRLVPSASGGLFSPDDSQLAYFVPDPQSSGNRGTLMIEPSAGGPATQLATDVGGVKGFSPSGASLLVLSPAPSRTASIVPASGGAAVPLLSSASQAFFVGDSQVAAVRSDAAPPFSFQNGLYLLDARP